MAVSAASLPPRSRARPVSGRPRPALKRWLIEKGEPVIGPVTSAAMSGGRTNLMSLVTDRGGHQWVLRERGPGDDRGFAREAKVMESLARLGLPVPRVISHGPVGRGRAVLVTAWSPGETMHDELDAGRLPVSVRHARGMQVIETLAELHRIEPDVAGLPRFATGHLDRQLACMSHQWARSGSSGVHDAAWRALRTRLVALQPARRWRLRLVHGDYRLGNLVFDNGKVGAVLDWERCTAGDPLTDVAWLLNSWRTPDEPSSCPASPTRVGGFPSRSELISAYHARTGVPIYDLGYYRGLAHWSAATLLQAAQTRARSIAGVGEMASRGIGDATIAAELLAAASMLQSPG